MATEKNCQFPSTFSNGQDWPRISIVTPSYNQGEFIEATIQSVLFQGYPNLEYIIIDGGSQDGSIQVIKKYERHLAYWHSKKDKGQADAINQGMRLATGEVVGWINSDDMYLPGTLQEVSKRFTGKTNNCCLLYGSALTMQQDSENLQGYARVAGAFDAETLTYSDYIVQPSTFWTRKLWIEVGELNASYHYVLDWEWFIRASRITSFEYIPRFLSIYRLHGQNKTGTGGWKRIGEINDIVERYAPENWRRFYRLVFSHYLRMIKIRRFLIKMRIPGCSFLLPFFSPGILREGGVRSRARLMTVLHMYGMDRA